MTVFSQMLADLIAETDVSVQLMAQYCGMDRSYLYKIIRGKRTPSDIQTVRKIAEYLHLTPKEEQDLLERWEITELGADVFYRRRAVDQFLADFPFEGETQNREFQFSVIEKSSIAGESVDGERTTVGESDTAFLQEEDVLSQGRSRVLRGKNAIETYLLHLFLETAKEKENRIQMLLPPEKRILHLFSYLHESVQLPVDHVFLFDRQDRYPQNLQQAEAISGNIDCIRQIIPLYTYSIDYHSYYYYGDPAGTGSILRIFPFLIQSENESILLSETLDSALILTDRESVDLLHRRYQEFLDMARPLVQKIDDPLALIQNLITHVMSQDDKGYSFQMLPCLTQHLTPEILLKHVTLSQAAMEEFGRIMGAYMETIENQYDSGSCMTMLSADGVRHFLKTGKFAEYPDDLYTPVDPEERIQLIQGILNLRKDAAVQYRMVKENIGNVSYGADIYVNRNSGYMMFRNPKTDRVIYLDVLETSLLYAFYDYLESMKPERFYSQAEMKNIIKGILKEFQQ